MAYKILILCATLAYASAGLLPAYAPAPAVAYAAPALAAAPISYTAPALTSQSSNIYRSFGNLGQVSTYSKSIDTPFSSVRKADVRVSNPGLRIATAAVPYAAAPLAAAPVAHAPLLGVAYSAAPAVSHMTYVSGITNYAF
ncbi:pupal cuticle protein C1B [Leptinotarsa decemlineata]|uniref:pupal cuticle protein C1B n=1 Tax=Leptinotarsa decemlineata TaxID=7539 RepID=UPI003D309F84